LLSRSGAGETLPQKELGGNGRGYLIVACTAAVVPHYQTDVSLRVSMARAPPLKRPARATVDQRPWNVSRFDGEQEIAVTRLHDTGFRNSAVTFSNEVAADPEKSNCGGHPGNSGQRAAHKDS
jgi:hypothetical protein